MNGVCLLVCMMCVYGSGVPVFTYAHTTDEIENILSEMVCHEYFEWK